MELPHRQRQLLDLIAEAARQGRTPVIAQLIHDLGLARESSLTNLIKPLERKELITIEGGGQGRQRILVLTPRGKMAAGLGLPVVGCIAAGQLREAIEECDEWINTVHAMLPYRAGDFLLRVEGDSMIGDGILPGDRVLLRPNLEVGQGEIAAVQVEGDGEYCATLKHLYRSASGQSVSLRASNPRYPDLEVDAERVQIAGVYRGLVRPDVNSRSNGHTV